MAVPTNPNDAHKAIMAQVLAEDVELRDMARQLIVVGMREILNQLYRGDAQTRASIAKSLAHTLTRAITDVNEDDVNANLRAEMQQMIGEMRGELMPDETPLERPQQPVAKSMPGG